MKVRTLIPLPKQKKARGPLKHVRPICLLNSSRKVLSRIALDRMRNKLDPHTGPTQSSKGGRSCGNVLWAYHMLITVVMKKHWLFWKMGIDMSRAFDTIDRNTIRRVLADAAVDEDELRIVRTLLADTKLRVRVGQAMSEWFRMSIGSPQGDSLSPALFTSYLASALEGFGTPSLGSGEQKVTTQTNGSTLIIYFYFYFFSIKILVM